MLLDAVRLLLFPAMMAFAASSDLLTMTISNRVSLILLGGFFALALATGMPLETVGMHVGAALLVFVIVFIFFARGWRFMPGVMFGAANSSALDVRPVFE